VDRQLWKYGFYAVIESYRAGIGRKTGQTNAAQTFAELQFQEFLLEAHGFYGNLMVNLSQTFGLESFSVLDHGTLLHQAMHPHIKSAAGTSSTGHAAELTAMAIRVMAHCLICMGDLARYVVIAPSLEAGLARGMMEEHACCHHST
jgi:hypothetical protein